MKVALFLCAILTVTLVGVFPGEGPGFQDHPDGFTEVVHDRLSYVWLSVETQYFWLKEEYGDDVNDVMDWCLDNIFEEKIKVQGISTDAILRLRQKRLNKFGDLLVIVIMAFACGTMIRKTLKKSFHEELKCRRREAILKSMKLNSLSRRVNVSEKNKKSIKSHQKRRRH